MKPHGILLICLLATSSYITSAQTNNFSGIWKLAQREVLAGGTYTNGLPDVVIISSVSAKMFFEYRSRGDASISKEELSVGGKDFVESITDSKRKRISRAGWISENKSFTKLVSFSSASGENNIEFFRNEVWMLSDDQKYLSISREHRSVKNTDEKFAMTGVYRKITAEELEIDKATGKGIKFEEGLAWSQLLEKAQTENKFLFVDCYATWCRPCKEMDEYVYPVDRLGEFMNSHFISVKVQSDSTKNDVQTVKLLYPAARMLERTYDIKSLPTYLFFSPDGKVVHRSVGKLEVEGFLTLAKEALDPDKQLYTLINNWKKGKVKYVDMPASVKLLKTKSDKKNALAIARDYMIGHLNKLSEVDFLKKENLVFIGENIDMVVTKDKVYQYYLKQPKKMDLIMDKGYSNRFVNIVLYREKMAPVINLAKKDNKEPDWKKVNQEMIRASDKTFAEENLAFAKMNWYGDKKDLKNSIRYTIEYVNLVFPKNDNVNFLNSMAMDIFLKSNNKAELESAIPWAEKGIQVLRKQNDHAFLAMVIDTKANLLYKAGKPAEAIKAYEEIFTFDLDKESKSFYDSIFAKIKNGEPTWVEIK